MKTDPQQIPFVKAGQSITAEQYNSLLSAVRANHIRPSADHNVSHTTAGAFINNKEANGGGGSTEEFNHAFKVTNEIDPDITDPVEVTGNLHFRVEAGNCNIIGGGTTSFSENYLQIPRNTAYNTWKVGFRYVYDSNYTEGDWFGPSGLSSYDWTGLWPEYSTGGHLIAQNKVIATVTLDGSSPSKTLAGIVQNHVGDVNMWEPFINTNSFGDA